MKIAVYGAGQYGQYIYNEIVKSEHANISVSFWIDNFTKEQEICGLPVYKEKDFFNANKLEEIDAVVIAMRYIRSACAAVGSMLAKGYERIYMALAEGFLAKVPILNEEGNFSPFIKFYREIKPTTWKMQIMVTNKCNLNCKRCAFFANLSTENDFLDLDEYENYLKQLQKKFKSVSTFDLLGGEPLLNPHLDTYIDMTKKYFPRARIDVQTNGLLITKMSRELIDTMVRCNAFFRITQYPPIREKLEQIIRFLEKEQIEYYIGEPVTQFEKTITLKENDIDDVFAKRFDTSCFCNGIVDGRIYLCLNIPRFYAMKDYFDVPIEENELKSSSIDLMDDKVDGWDIIKYFYKPVSLCRFCSYGNEWVDWETGQPRKEDWIVDEL